MSESFTDAIFRLPSDSSAPERLAALEHKIAECAMALDAGDVSPLDGVDKEVEILCGQVMKMPTEEAMPYIQKMQTLSDAFTALGDAMSAEKEALRDELGNLQSRHKAHRAYGMHGPSTPPVREEGDE